MIKFVDAQIGFARAIYALLSESNEHEWFSVDQIVQKSEIMVGTAFASRVLSLSQDEDEIFLSNDDYEWTLGKEGFDLVEAEASADSSIELAPAANRIVRFNHNSAEAQQVSLQLEKIREAVRGANSPEIDEQERERVFKALTVAEQLWQSANLKIIQLRIGVLMAAEDAASLLQKTSHHVAAALLVDAIKSFAKNHIHVDLDGI